MPGLIRLHLTFQDCKSLNYPHYILVGPNIARIQKKWAVNLIAFQGLLFLYLLVFDSHSLVDSIVNNCEFFAWNLKETFHVSSSRFGNSNNMTTAPYTSLGSF